MKQHLLIQAGIAVALFGVFFAVAYLRTWSPGAVVFAIVIAATLGGIYLMARRA
jgi:hypothetical protein